MSRYLLRRLIEAVISVWGVLTIVFFVGRLLGDPVSLLVPIGASVADMERLRAGLGLDLPLWQQYLTYMGQVLQGDFGTSFVFNQPAMQVVLERMPATAQLAGAALAIGVLIGGTAGIIAALNKGRWPETLVLGFAMIGQATPTFWLGIMAILFFAVQLGWVPTGGYGTWQHLLLPAFTVAIFISASIARLLRSSMLDTLREDYVRTARAKGLMPRTILMWHTLRNALIPVITMIGILVGELLGGAVVTETVFAWPGVGRLIFQAIDQKDFPVIQAGVVLVATIFVVANFLVDLLYAVLDPRIKEGRA
ncbi:oligopeptide ABC transporter permease protein (plasmid) [Ketogulonicigenium vulgare Y25]|uniref:Oligopeptide ABC transporter permease protein n=1 Tax=Ketogulonicigenium vulgare (strain WSH-001) TaxID=759362 RepID=F9YBV6_KETVW|nr:ABC transporter permease [Ketogulonicigenium vulgare]ADO44205.1 oligopeptide ABC transporter permease protein [Ketogulonicigenium vulgare Y25]AEM42858.1 Oligopeptide ABC transporter permease protein [Ketogulonicigenium vulgare WSH-001]ALJ82715.1 ABC transporter permease [Ketogulonicigenium vulgare]